MINVYELIRFVMLIVVIYGTGIVLLLVIGAISNFFRKIRRRRRAMMEDDMPKTMAWLGGDPNQKVPESARPVKFDPDDFVE